MTSASTNGQWVLSMQGCVWRSHSTFLTLNDYIRLQGSNRSVAVDVTPFPQSVWQPPVCSDQSDSMLYVATGGGAGILCQSKSVLVTCVLVRVVLPLEKDQLTSSKL